jgi:integrase
MAWDVLNQILEFARVRKLLNEDLLLGMKPFKDSGQANDDDFELADEPEDADVMPYDADQIEAIIAAAEGWQRALVTLYFFTGIRRGEALALTWDRVYLDRDRALINRSLSFRYGITTPKTKSSRRMIQYGPRVRAELLKQRERVQLPASTSSLTRAALRPMCAGPPTWCGAGFSRGSSAPTDRALPSQLRGHGAEAAQTAQLDSAADGTSHAANVVETLLALDTDRRSFCRRNVFAGERSGAVGLKSCPPYAHPARNRHRSGLVKR